MFFFFLEYEFGNMNQENGDVDIYRAYLQQEAKKADKRLITKCVYVSISCLVGPIHMYTFTLYMK